ncbi:hypothetical protein CRE_23542 [Caenorhabditis remanei]|uniref:Serpentine Receptor, class Z n=1 Tax=Caenorhabditis remanei TaxID=31234 RepID=E3MHA1_CAERE|nr:hypothetical protein CRE_23542 [Caenorhabditis remanei]
MDPPLNSSVREHMITDDALSNTPLLISALVIYLSLQFLTFPFYIHIFRKNQERDKNIPIFPIVEHFYKLIKLAVLSTCLILAAVVLIQIFALETVKLGLTIFMVCVFPISEILCEVIHLMLSLLAIQRFLLYFFPSSDSLLNISAKNMKRLLYCVYFLSILIHITIFTIAAVEEKLHDFIKTLYYACLNLLIFVSTCLYIPIVMSLRKLVHLQSSQLNHPQRYVLWQLVVILMEKSFYISILFLYPSFTAYETMRMFTAIDVLLLPMTIQLTYVGCNRRNVQSLLASSKSILRVFCCPCVPTQVYVVSTLEPVAVGFDVSTTRQE